MFCASTRYFQQISYFPFLVSISCIHPHCINQAGMWWLCSPANIDCRHPSPTSAIHTIVARTQCGIHPSSCQQSQMLWVNKTSFEYWVDTSTCLLWNVDGRYRYFDHWTVLQILNSVTRLRAPGSRRTWRCRGWRWSGGRRGWRACPAGCSGPRGQPSAGSRATGIRFN